MRLKPKDRARLRQLGLKMAMGGDTWADFGEDKITQVEQMFDESPQDGEGNIHLPAERVRELTPGIEQLDLSGGLRVRYSVVVVAGEGIQRNASLSRSGGRRVSRRLVLEVLECLGFGECRGDWPSRSPTSGVWHAVGDGPPPGSGAEA